MLAIIQLGLGNLGNKPSTAPSPATEQGMGAIPASITLPNQIPLGEELPLPTAETVQKRYGTYQIGSSSMITNITQMTSSAPGSSGAENYYICSVTLSGPEFPPQSFSLVKPSTWSAPATKEVRLQMQIPSADCPDWEHANRYLMAIQLGLLSEEGCVTTSFTSALHKRFDAQVT